VGADGDGNSRLLGGASRLRAAVSGGVGDGRRLRSVERVRSRVLEQSSSVKSIL
jgi:hypothetical protein